MGKYKLNHWFDGYGMLHGFIFQNGEIYYHSKYIDSPEYLSVKKNSRLTGVSWGTGLDPCTSIFGKLFSTFTNFPSNTNVAVAKIGEKYFTTSDIAVINEFDIHTLKKYFH